MTEEAIKIKSFVDLKVWQSGHKLVLNVYGLTKKFPKEEQFALTNQLRRAVVSFTSCIAEGFSRRSYKDKANFYSMALGSLTEAQNQLLISRDLNYISKDEYQSIQDDIVTINKMTNGLIKSSRTYIHNS